MPQLQQQNFPSIHDWVILHNKENDSSRIQSIRSTVRTIKDGKQTVYGNFG